MDDWAIGRLAGWCHFVEVMAPSASNATHACPTNLRDRTNKPEGCDQNHAVYTFGRKANAATLKLTR